MEAWDNSATSSGPLTRETFERGIRAIREAEYRPVEHIMNPRAWRGEWTQCTCGRFHRFVDDQWWETA